jgi:hypothetical protein
MNPLRIAIKPERILMRAMVKKFSLYVDFKKNKNSIKTR